MIRLNLIRGYSASNTMVARTGGDWPVFELRKAKKLLRKSLHVVRREAAKADEGSAGVLSPSSEQRPITGNLQNGLTSLSCSEIGTTITPLINPQYPSVESRALVPAAEKGRNQMRLRLLRRVLELKPVTYTLSSGWTTKYYKQKLECGHWTDYFALDARNLPPTNRRRHCEQCAEALARKKAA